MQIQFSGAVFIKPKCPLNSRDSDTEVFNPIFRKYKPQKQQLRTVYRTDAEMKSYPPQEGMAYYWSLLWLPQNNSNEEAAIRSLKDNGYDIHSEANVKSVPEFQRSNPPRDWQLA